MCVPCDTWGRSCVSHCHCTLVSLCPVLKALGHGVAGTQWDWDWDTVGLGHSGTGTQWDWPDTMGMENNGTGTQWDWDTVGVGHTRNGTQRANPMFMNFCIFLKFTLYCRTLLLDKV